MMDEKQSKRMTTYNGAHYFTGSHTHEIFKKFKGKGWFMVKDAVPIYAKGRGITPKDYQWQFMSGDTSWVLKRMAGTGVAERKPKPGYPKHFVYRIIG